MHPTTYSAVLSSALALALLLFSPVAPAQDTDDTVDIIEPLVVTGTRTEKTLSDSPVKVDVLTREDLTARQVNTVAEALSHVSGVQLRAIHGDQGEEITLQGMNGDQVAVLVDGMPVSASTGSTVNLSRLSLGQVERIEVVRGATSALHGSAAMGGVVNIITREADTPEVSLRWQGSYLGDQATDLARLGVIGEQWVNAAIATGQRGPWRNRLSVDWHDSAGSDRNPDTRTHDTFDGQTLALDNRLGWRLNGHDLRLDTHWFTTDLQRPVDQDDVPFSYTDNTDRLSLGLTWSRPALAFAGRVDSTTQVKGEWFAQTTAQNAVLTDVTEHTREADMSLGYVNQQWDLALGEHWLTLGADYQRATLAQTRTTQDMNGDTDTTEEVSERSQQNTSLFIQDDFFLGERLELLPGARAQWDEGFGTFFAPKINLRWDPAFMDTAWFDGHVRAGVGVGYRVPNLKERHYFFDHSQFGYQVRGNPDLEPEQNLSWQLGTELTGDTWTMDVSAYLNQAESLIVTDLDEDLSAQESLDIYRYQNIDRARITGLDTQWRLRYSPRLHLNLAYSLTDARNLDTDNRLPGRTPHVVTAGLDYYPTDRIHLNASTRRYSPTWADSENTQRTPAWVNLDAVVNIEASRHLDLFVGGNNLFDELQPLDSTGDQRPLTGQRFFAGLQGQF